MNSQQTNKLVLFGAGKIGRSFIAQLFSRGGYEVVFIDIARPVIEEINRRREYNLIIKGDSEEIIKVKNIRGVLASDEDLVVKEIATAGIMAVSVGSHGLVSLIPLIAKGLLKRYKQNSENALDIIIAENLRNAADFLKDRLEKELPSDYPLNVLVGLVETSIGKMVPIMPKRDEEEDVLQVFAEPYNTLILDKQAFKNPIPQVDGLSPKENMKAWVDRKLFIHNLGHVSAAYCGSYLYPDLTYMYEILEKNEVRKFTRQAMLQSSEILRVLHPGVFSEKHMEDHIDDLINRFCNKALGDTVFRVGCDLPRKLGSDDRLLAPFHAGVKFKLPVNTIAEAIFYGMHFNGKDENHLFLEADAEFLKRIITQGYKQVLISTSGLDKNEYKVLAQEFEKHGISI